MARILFGRDFVDGNCVILGNVNVNSPLVWDATMTTSLRAYARANQAAVIVPVHPRRRHGAGDQCRRHRPVAGRDHGRLRADPARAPGRAGDLRQFPLVDVAALRLADLRHAGTRRRQPRRRPVGPPAEPAAQMRRQLLQFEAAGRPGDERGHHVDALGGPLRRQLHPAFGRLPRRPARRCPTRNSSWTPISAARCIPISPASRSTTTRWRSTPSAKSVPASTSSAAPTPWRTTRSAFWDTAMADNEPFEKWQAAGRPTRPPAPTPLEEDARRIRGAAARRGDRRGASGFHQERKAEMGDAWY